MNLIQSVFNINIELESGLHIGGGDSTIEIGGVDNKVIRHALTNEPYIPGSSLKGKLRYLLTQYYLNDQAYLELIDVLFGVGGDSRKNNKRFMQSRLQFVDIFLTEQSKDKLNRDLGMNIYTVVKYENTIDSTTLEAVPRPVERVPKGVSFEGKIILSTFGHLQDSKESMMEVLNKGIELLNKNYLGGSGSRGYGKVLLSLKEV
jgi:CRISPR-associated protein Csm3